MRRMINSLSQCMLLVLLSWHVGCAASNEQPKAEREVPSEQIGVSSEEHDGEPHDDGSLWDGYVPFMAVDGEPTYHVLDGYDPRWQALIRQGIDEARAYWGSYGPVHVWILGRGDDTPVDHEAEQAFIEGYCDWRTATTERTIDECLPHARRQFIEVLERGEPEAYLSVVRETNPHMAELVFINVQDWHFEDDPLPDPILRGIHEYTHVFQQSVGRMPTWMMEGGAVFIESWLPALDGRRPIDASMPYIMQRARAIEETGLTIADMEDVDTVSEDVKRYYLELAYDSGAWATVFLIDRSPTRSVSAMRDELYPLIKAIGWEAALAQYVGMKDTAEFYAAFDVFMERPLDEQVAVLKSLQP